MSINNFIKRVQDIMRKDKGVGTNDILILEQLVWLLFLYVYDTKESEWEIFEKDFQSIIPDEYRWRNWAVDNKDGEALTGDMLLEFIDSELLPELKELDVNEETERRKGVVKAIFEDSNNYMKDGTYLRQIINVINDLNFDEISERHAFNDIYEGLLKSLQTAGNNGQYFTPRACTNFMTEIVNPQIGETVADFACGTGGFLVSAFEHLNNQNPTVEEREFIEKNIYGIEKFHLPYLLGVTNLILHGIDTPKIDHRNSLTNNILDFSEDEKFDTVLMNPPFGSKSEGAGIQHNFPTEFQTSETADLFMAYILHRLKVDGRVGIILPDGFMFGDGVKNRLKQKLLKEFNLHTIVRLPGSVFAPYTSISTNILFFDYNQSGTKETWYYELPLPEGYKAFSKTKPMQDKHFKEVKEWWDDRKETEQAWKVTKEEIEDKNYNLDINNPNVPEEEKHDPKELLRRYNEVETKIKGLQEMLKNELKDVL